MSTFAQNALGVVAAFVFSGLAFAVTLAWNSKRTGLNRAAGNHPPPGCPQALAVSAKSYVEKRTARRGSAWANSAESLYNRP